MHKTVLKVKNPLRIILIADCGMEFEWEMKAGLSLASGQNLKWIVFTLERISVLFWNLLIDLPVVFVFDNGVD